MGAKIPVREVLLYSERIKSDDVLNFFNQIMKSRLPFLGFLDFSDFLSLNVANTIIRRKLNTVQFYIREKKALAELSLLVFPYKLSDPKELEAAEGSLLPLPKFYMLMGDRDFLGFMLKESMEEVNLRIVKVLGKFLAIGTAVDEKRQKHIVVCTSPERFYVSDLEKNPSVYIEILDPIPKRMSVTSHYPVFEETGISVGVDNFDVFQHTLFVGASGTGKSKGLYALIKAIEAKYGDTVRMLVIDPHGEFIRAFPQYKAVNLIDNYIEPLDVGGVKTPLMTQLIAQLLSSAIGQENKYSERVLFYATHLLSSINKMDLKNISLLLTDSSKRAEFISETENDEVKRFFDEEFNDIYIHHFNDAVLPILNFVGEYELYLGGDKKRENLLDLIKNNRITLVSFNPNFFGKRMINFMAGAIINQMYILAITERLNMPTILVMDEFQRVETRVVKDMLSETRKFNLFVYLSMQYLGQLSKDVHDSIVSNIRNIVSFKANRQDATMLSSIMEIKIEESFKKSRSQTELEESKKEMFVRLHQKECIVRLFDGKKYILPMKLRVVDVYSKWGYKEVPLEEVMPAPKVSSELRKKLAQEGAEAQSASEEERAVEDKGRAQASGQTGASGQQAGAADSQSQEPAQDKSGENEWGAFKSESAVHLGESESEEEAKRELAMLKEKDEAEAKQSGNEGEEQLGQGERDKEQPEEEQGQEELRARRKREPVFSFSTSGFGGEGASSESQPRDESDIDSEELSAEADSVPGEEIRTLEEELMLKEEELAAKIRAKMPKKAQAVKNSGRNFSAVEYGNSATTDKPPLQSAPAAQAKSVKFFQPSKQSAKPTKKIPTAAPREPEPDEPGEPGEPEEFSAYEEKEVKAKPAPSSSKKKAAKKPLAKAKKGKTA